MQNKNRPYHIPVLIDEVIHYLAIKPGGVYVDATFGGGGHTRAILQAEPTCSVIAIDWDTVALEKNGEQLQTEFPERLTLVWGNFSQIDKLLAKIDVESVDGIIADFGTSQYQLFERPGFSFTVDSPLDMRMSPAHQKITAAELLNKASEQVLIDIFRELGQEPKARAIAKAIVQERNKYTFRTTKQLASLVERVVGYKKEKKMHPATQVFQALRIYINQELQNIHSFLRAALRVLKPGGRLVCISFHSLEDRLVKEYFREQKAADVIQLVTSKVVIPTDQEIARNPASRSAKLRVAELLAK